MEINNAGLASSQIQSVNSSGTLSVEELTYAPLESPDHIRLLRILPGDSYPLAVTLEEVDIDTITYECLSYTWDGPKYEDVSDEWTTNIKPLLCNDAKVTIRQNLHDYLAQARSDSQLGPIWIDALCINQNDLQERQQQVGLMCRIYEGAQRVIVWLGVEDEHTAPALQHLQRFKITVEEVSNPLRRMQLYQEASYTDEEFETIFCFLAPRRWFSRLWTVQETVLARDLIYKHGPYDASLQTICAGACAIGFRDARLGWYMKYGHMWDQAGLMTQFTSVAWLRHEWHQTDQPVRIPIGHNANYFTDFMASDLRDKVFGLLGISNCKDDFLGEVFMADYTATVCTVFTKSARFQLASCKHLGALSWTQGTWEKNVMGLPSWVPDLTVRRVYNFEREEPYLQASLAEADAEVLEFEDDVLVLAAWCCDQIVSVGEPRQDIENLGTIYEYLNVFLNSGPDCGYQGEEIVAAMRRILMADHFTGGAQAILALQSQEYDSEAAFDDWLFRFVCWALSRKVGTTKSEDNLLRESLLPNFISDPADNLDSAMSILGFAAPLTYAALSPSILRGGAKCEASVSDFQDSDSYDALRCDNDPFAGSWWRLVIDHVPFRTEMGFVGLCSKGVEVGDKIAFVAGASAMYIFRPWRTEDDADEDVIWENVVKVPDGPLSLLSDAVEVTVGPGGEVPCSDEVPTPRTVGTDLSLLEAQSSLSGLKISESRSTDGIANNKETNEEEKSRVDNNAEDTGITTSKKAHKGKSRDSGDGGHFALVGEAYLHGVMYGEAFQNRAKDFNPWKKIRVH